jgi:hypothetical protein
MSVNISPNTSARKIIIREPNEITVKKKSGRGEGMMRAILFAY